MKYFQIINERRPKIIGRYPQVDNILTTVPIDDPRYIGDRFFEPLPSDVVIPNAILEKKAKLTDLLSAMLSGFNLKLLISKKTYELIADHKSEGLEFFQTYLITKDEHKHSYFLVYPGKNCPEMLDFSSCEFSISSIDAYNGAKLDIRSPEDFLDKFFSLRAENKGTIRIDKIVLVDDVPCQMFCLGYVTLGGIGYYISEQLKNQFERAGLTGFEYIPVA